MMIVMMVMTMMLGDVVIKFLKPAQRKTLVHMFCVFGEVIMKMLVTRW